MKLDFICPGEGRCGTTTLHSILRQHPRVVLPVTKEPLWLNNYELCKSRDIHWYEEHYYGITKEAPQKESMIYGEVNPSFGVVSAKRLYDIFGIVKIIFLFRNPVERLWSHFNYCLNSSNIMVSDEKSNKLYQESRSRKEAFELFCSKNFQKIDGRVRYVGQFNNILSQHRYKFNCEVYCRYFKKENIKVILLEELEKDWEKTCSDILNFLGLEMQEIKCVARQNVGNYNVISENDYKLLSELEAKRIDLMIDETTGEEIQENIDRTIEAVKRIWQKDDKIQKYSNNISAEYIEILQDYFREDKEYVEEFLQKDLSDLWF